MNKRSLDETKQNNIPYKKHNAGKRKKEKKKRVLMEEIYQQERKVFGDYDSQIVAAKKVVSNCAIHSFIHSSIPFLPILIC